MESSENDQHDAQRQLTLTARHLPGLNGLRAFCVLLVFVSHASWTNGYPESLRQGLKSLPESVGEFGVHIFFVISGFLITTILLRKENLAWADLKRFYKRRALRILPPAYAYLLFLYVWSLFTEFNLGKIDVLGSVFFFRHLVGLNDCLHHFWSLSIEEQFYLFYPVVLLFAGQQRFKWTLILLASQTLVRGLARSTGNEDLTWFITNACRFDAILAGCLLAQVQTKASVKRLGETYGSLLIVSAASLIIGTFLWNKYLGLSRPSISEEFVLLIRNLCISGLIVALIADKSVLCRPFNIKWVAWVGSISYSLYLWQQFFFWPTPRSIWFHWFPMNVVLAFIVGVAANRLVERPFDKLRNQI